MIELLLERFEACGSDDAIIWRDRTYTYRWLLERVGYWKDRLEAEGVERGAVVALEADFSPNAAALLFALIERKAVCVPISSTLGATKAEEFKRIGGCRFRVTRPDRDDASIERFDVDATNPHYEMLRRRGHPGLVIFSSGSTGESKAAIHDFTPLLDAFREPRKKLRSIAFLLFDHIGGLNTLFYVLASGGCLITVRERTPDTVLRAVEKHRAELLPVSPTFLNLILLSEAYTRHDLTSLRTISYGSEPMPESTLRRLHELFPGVQLHQMYGMSEIGILRSKSRSSDSLWMKLGGEGCETRVVDGKLEVKCETSMLGYLNAPSPFTEDGWMITDDRVEVDGEYFRILGRDSEIINVGGEKVYPAEVEGVIQELDNVADVTVYGEPNPITGQIVCADVQLSDAEEKKALARRLKEHCGRRLQSYKVPVRVRIVEESLCGERFKKRRRRARVPTPGEATPDDALASPAANPG